MRVPQSMLSNNMLRNLSSSYNSMGKYQDQLSTGKKINRPSDDPVVAMKGMTYRANLKEIEQYKRNFSEAYNWSENTDSALDQATSALQRIRELTVQASNGTYEDSQKENIGKEIKELRDHLADIANSKVGGKYIFNGTDSLEPPVDLANGTFPSNSGEVKVELSNGIFMTVNVNATKIFSNDDSNPGKGLFSDLKSLVDDLNSGGDIEGYLVHLDEHLNTIVQSRAEIGARTNRIELMEARIDSQEIIANRILSDNEDADIEKVITELKTQETIHRAALGVGSRIIQPTLMDFLR